LSRSGVTLSDDAAHPDEAGANNDALQDVCLTRRTGPEDGDRCLNEAATRYRDQREVTEAARSRFQPIHSASMSATAR